MTATFVVPPELVLAEAAARRMERQLAAAPDDVVGVAAETAIVPPGSSTRTHAEWCATAPLDTVSPSEATIDGAVLLRDGVGFEVTATNVTVAAGTVLVDRGAVAHRPASPGADIEAETAGPRSRPPFRWRPVVLFLAVEATGAIVDAARGLANDLIELDVEARLATGAPASGPHLTQPCAPTEASMRALRPDVVVALDPSALEDAARWCDDRGTVFVTIEGADTDTIELVSWRIGTAQGRRRAHIGLGVAAADLAALVNRLCAGPPPMPPVESSRRVLVEGEGSTRVGVGRRARRGDRAGGRSVVAIGSASGRRPARHDGLLAQLGASGHRVSTATSWAAAEVAAADILLVEAGSDAGPLREWIAQRADSAHRAVVVIDDEHDDQPGSRVDELVSAAGAALAPTRIRADALRATGARVLVLPTLLPDRRIAELQTAASHRVAPSVPLIGWRTGRGPDAGVTGAAVAALERLMDRVPDLAIEVSGPLGGELAERPPVAIRSIDPDPSELAAWTIQLWTPAGAPTGQVGDPTAIEIVEAGLAGVPTVSLALGQTRRGDRPGPEVTNIPGADPDDAASALAALLDVDARLERSRRASAQAESLHGSAAAQMAIERFVGWLDRGVTP